MQRREFIGLIGGAAAWPLAARAQRTAALSKVGVLLPYLENDPGPQSLIATFRGALAQLGWTEGSNLQIDLRWGGADTALLARYAAEMVALGPQVLFGDSTAALRALRRETSTIPIVFSNVVDPVGQGFVPNLPHPGGNITGFTTGAGGFSLAGKWIEMLRQVSPPISRVAVLYNPETTPYADPFVRSIKEAAEPFAVDVQIAPVHSISKLEEAVAAGLDENVGLMVLPSVFTSTHRAAIIAFAAQHRLPLVSSFPFFAVDGGLMTYGVEVSERVRSAAGYVNRILRGEKPGDLPIQQPTKYVLVVNLKTARALGITIAPSLLAIADDVIE
jgi:putative tryptophan/tyrosine transport system substrate-binding protein